MHMLLACTLILAAAIAYMTHVAGVAKTFVGPFTGYALFSMMVVLLFAVFAFEIDLTQLARASAFSFVFNYAEAFFHDVRAKQGRLKGYAVLLGLVIAPTCILAVLNWKMAAMAWAVTLGLRLVFHVLAKLDDAVKRRGK